MADDPSPNTIPQTTISESLGPRGLSTKQQNDIATIQGQASYSSRQQQDQQRQGSISTQSSTLLLNELDPSVDESILSSIFSNYGQIDSIELCRDSITNKSLGYARIHFGTEDIQIHDAIMINGVSCRTTWQKKDKPTKPSTTVPGNLFIRNLDPSVTTKSLLDTFSLYGNISNCKIVTDERGRSKGYGFIRYDTADAAERAIINVNGMTLYDRELFVGHHIPKQERIQRLEEAKQRFTNVYVKNLVTDITEEELEELFGGFGPIASVLIQRDEQGQSRGFGFVNFERHEDAERAVLQMHATEYIGKRLFVSRAQKRSEREEELRRQHDLSSSSSSPSSLSSASASRPAKYHGVNLYVKHLADGVDDKMLKDLFAPFGPITSAKVMREDKTSQSKGFGFVCFHTPKEADRAVQEMNGATVLGKELYVALAQKKEDRRHHLESQLTTQQQQQRPLIQAPFVPNYGLYYDTYPPYPPSSSSLSLSSSPPPNIGIPRPIRWNHAPQPIVKHVYPSNDEPQMMMDDLETQKQMLGERIYKAVYAKHADVAGKVTGMLLEMDLEGLEALVKNKDLLDEKTQEAIEFLNRHQVDMV